LTSRERLHRCFRHEETDRPGVIVRWWTPRDDPTYAPLLHALIERECRVRQRLVRHLLMQGVGPYFYLHGQEYLTPPMHGPRDSLEFNARDDRRGLIVSPTASVFMPGRGGDCLEQCRAMIEAATAA
jgi:hypothetical protein